MTAKRVFEDIDDVDFGSPPGDGPMSEAEYLAFIQVGIDELDRGEGIPHAVVMAEIKKMIADAQR